MDGTLKDSSNLLERPDALRARLAEDGYLFLRGVAPGDRLGEMRADILVSLAEAGWIRKDRPAEEMIAVDDAACAEPQDRYVRMMYAHSRLKATHALQHHPRLVGLFEQIVGGRVFQHPRFNIRYSFPNYGLGATLAHQDYPHVQGTTGTYTIWLPLDDLTRERSVLEVAEASHRDGVFDYRPAHGAGQMEAVQPRDYRWLSSDLRLGDAIVFHSLTLHRATPNRSDKLRISIDYRFQAEAEPVCERVLIPSNQRTDWEDLYAGWDDDAFKYYWRERPIAVVPFDLVYHDRRDAEAIRMGTAGDATAYNALQGIATGHRDPDMRARAAAALARLDARASG